MGARAFGPGALVGWETATQGSAKLLTTIRAQRASPSNPLLGEALSRHGAPGHWSGAPLLRSPGVSAPWHVLLLAEAARDRLEDAEHRRRSRDQPRAGGSGGGHAPQRRRGGKRAR